MLVRNPIDRYSISDRAPGVKYSRDGRLCIYIQAEAPVGEAVHNWLPAPAEPFHLILLCYGPKPELLGGE